MAFLYLPHPFLQHFRYLRELVRILNLPCFDSSLSLPTPCFSLELSSLSLLFSMMLALTLR